MYTASKICTNNQLSAGIISKEMLDKQNVVVNNMM